MRHNSHALMRVIQKSLEKNDKKPEISKHIFIEKMRFHIKKIQRDILRPRVVTLEEKKLFSFR